LIQFDVPCTNQKNTRGYTSFSFSFLSFFHLTNFYFFPVFFILFSFEGDFEDVEELSGTAEAIVALKKSILNMLAGLQ